MFMMKSSLRAKPQHGEQAVNLPGMITRSRRVFLVVHAETASREGHRPVIPSFGFSRLFSQHVHFRLGSVRRIHPKSGMPKKCRQNHLQSTSELVIASDLFKNQGSRSQIFEAESAFPE